MCKTYNTIGSLSTLKLELEKNKIYDFKSLNEVTDFLNSYTVCRKQIVSHHENLIIEEKVKLNIDLQQLDKTIEAEESNSKQKLTNKIERLKEKLNIEQNFNPTSFFQSLINNLKQLCYKWEIWHREKNFDSEVKKSVKKLVKIQQIKNYRYQYIISHFSEAVNQSSKQSLTEIERKKSILDKLSSFIYGALGEHKVVKTLETLSDEYFLINDFCVSFSKAIFNKQENDYIKSIQIDHILVAPSGIFIIETKNWSEKSLANLNLRSPVQQVRRTSFALFKLLNNKNNKKLLRLDKHHWGYKKISIKNLIVFINNKPKEEFQYVKLLTLNELLRYIKYFTPVFSNIETLEIANFLLKINTKKIIDIKKNDYTKTKSYCL